MSQSDQKERSKKTAKILKGSLKSLGYGLILMFLLVWVFALGVLTGRGDVHRWLQRLGLYKTEVAARLGLTPPQTETATLPTLPSADLGKTALAPANPTEGTAPAAGSPTVAANPADKPAAATVVPASASGPAKSEGHSKTEAKKGKTPAKAEPKTEHKDSIADKLAFQNSLDSPARRPAKTTAGKEKAKPLKAQIAPAAGEPAGAAGGATPPEKKKTPAYQVKIGSYRTAAEAQKALVELNKKGIKANLLAGKDKNGQTYTLQTPKYQSKAEAEKVVKKVREANLSGQLQEVKQ
jgi:hypothetical protein